MCCIFQGDAPSCRMSQFKNHIPDNTVLKIPCCSFSERERNRQCILPHILWVSIVNSIVSSISRPYPHFLAPGTIPSVPAKKKKKFVGELLLHFNCVKTK